MSLKDYWNTAQSTVGQQRCEQLIEAEGVADKARKQSDKKEVQKINRLHPAAHDYVCGLSEDRRISLRMDANIRSLQRSRKEVAI